MMIELPFASFFLSKMLGQQESILLNSISDENFL
jgi:hypothetical protein